MKILHLDFDDLQSPTAGGQAVRNFEINRRLVQHGHEITMVTLRYPEAKNENRENIRYERAGFIRYPFNFISYFLAVPFLIRRHDFDLVVEDNMPPFSFGLSPLYTKKPIITQIQSFGAKFASQKYKLPFWRLEKSAVKLYKNFIVLTKNIEQKILSINPQANVRIIGNGVSEISTFESNILPSKNFLLFLGRISFFTKGLDYLLEAMEILQKKRPDLQLFIAGRGPDEKRLLTLIEQKKLANVMYVGHVEGKEKEKLLAECLLLVQPSRHEIFPLTFLEAAAHRKAVVCFDVENIHELMKEKIGVATPAFDVKMYAAALLDLVENKAERERLEKNAYNWAKNHLWDKVAKEQEEFYLSCVKGR